MTEGDRAFYRRRMREEIRQAQKAQNEQLKLLHLQWAMLYQERLDGSPKSVSRALEKRLQTMKTSAIESDCHVPS